MASGPSPSAVRRPARAALQHRDFALYLWARILGSCGIEFQITGVSWHVYQLTGQPFDLGLIGFAQFAPFLVLFLVSGAVADRFPRTRVLSVCGVLHTCCALLLYLLTLTGAGQFSLVFPVLIFMGVARAFQSPAQQAIVPLLVPREHFASAVAWTTSATQGVRIGAPALAGGLLLLGQVYVYGAAIGCLALSALCTMLIRANTQVVSTERPSWAALLGGLTFIGSRPILLGTIALDLCAVFLGGATALLPIYAVDILHVGAAGFGCLRAAQTVGTLACTLALIRWPLARRAGVAMLGSVALFGVATVVFGLSRSFLLSLLVLGIMGAADAISVFIRAQVIQIVPPDHMRGRVSAVNAVFIGASNELGAFESGLTAAWWGVVPAVVVGGLGTIAVALGFFWRFPSMKTLDALDHEALIRQYR
ncbi:MAG: MFS transporter [Candidatus Tectimicrobiota bacterium]